MKNYRNILLIALFCVYAIGLLSGGVNEKRQDNQAEMYTYLENAISEYDASVKESVLQIAKENLVFFGICAIGIFIKTGVLGIAPVLFVRGYAAGFAITAAMRLYGFGGILLSLANVISLAILIPVLCTCGGAASLNMTENKLYPKTLFARGCFLVMFLAAIFAADCILRGVLTAVFTDFAAGILK